MPSIEIRPERPEDSGPIGALITTAFAEAEHRSGTEAAIVEALRSAGALAVSLVAVEDGEIVGHVALSPVTIEPRTAGWYGLGPVSVLSGRQRAGIGAALVEAALSRLKALGATGCVVLGDPRYYARFGFVSDPTLRYGDVPPEYFQRIFFEGPAPTGEVTYHPGFDAT